MSNEKQELLEAGYSAMEVAEIIGDDFVVDVPVLNDDVMAALSVAAERMGITKKTYAFRSLRRVFEKVERGMSFDAACASAGLSVSDVERIAVGDPALRDMFLGARHKMEIRMMDSVMRSADEDGKLALEVLSRQTSDFKPAKQRVEVSKTVDVRGGWVE